MEDVFEKDTILDEVNMKIVIEDNHFVVENNHLVEENNHLVVEKNYFVVVEDNLFVGNTMDNHNEVDKALMMDMVLFHILMDHRYFLYF